MRWREGGREGRKGEGDGERGEYVGIPALSVGWQRCGSV